MIVIPPDIFSIGFFLSASLQWGCMAFKTGFLAFSKEFLVSRRRFSRKIFISPGVSSSRLHVGLLPFYPFPLSPLLIPSNYVNCSIPPRYHEIRPTGSLGLDQGIDENWDESPIGAVNFCNRSI